ncbi:unnamed protein product [Prorocentrum cordatum]|uniref:C2 domain-containing protein n=1 Tax=Prorocentrum cordatum TaxID=2364126 RepID=A0ABN9VJR2_9DINO|nr:unnamed protein product [Polarella glacialis]
MKEEHRGDKVPGWDGDPKAWRTYRRKALQYQEGTKRQDRLTGRAEVAVGRCKSGWLSRDDGVERLLAWLGRRCSRRAVPDVGQELGAFLIKTRRRELEPIHWRWVEVENGEDDEGPSWTCEYTDGRGEDETGSRTWSVTNDDDAEEELDDVPEVSPSIVRGWLMLARAGLDSRERSAIVTAAGGSLEVGAIRDDLISTWGGDDLAERDGRARCPKAYAAQMGDDDRTRLDEDDVGQGAGGFAAEQEHEEFDEEHDMAQANDEDIESCMAAQQEEAEALAAIRTAQRTLRRAREAQAGSRLSRGFYRGGRPGSQVNNAPEASAKMATRTKELQFNLVAAMAILEGKGIVDLGCADTMGGERALDIVARESLEKYGDARLRDVSLSYQPVYSFGNGERGRACGQVKFGIAGAGNEGYIAIDGFAKDVPILVSKKVLKKLGAVIDCDTGVAVFVKLAPKTPVQLEESPDGGHYYMSLVDDVLEDRVQGPVRLQNFKNISQHVSEWGREVHHLREAEAVELIRDLGLSISPAWSMGELRHAIRETLFPKAESASLKTLKGISTMKKQELAQKAEEVGAHLAPNMTNAAMKLEIRKAALMKTMPEPTDFLGFGKHGALTCQQVRIQYPSYAEWAQKEASTASSWELTRFVSWLNEMKVVQEMTKGPVEAQVAGAPRGAEGSEFRGQFYRSGAQSEWSGRGLNHVKEPDPRKQRWLAKCIRESNSTEDFEALIAHGGAKLMELACSPASILSTKMAEKFGEEAVQRVSSWNGHELGAAQGNQKARETGDKAEPDHLWISTRCGPLSTLTLGFNASNPAGAEVAMKRRLQAIKEYKGAVQLVYDQVAQGRRAHWERPIKCEGWGHAMIRQMIDDCSMTVVKVAGCQLGVTSMVNSWAGLTASTSYCADVFARGAVRAMIEEAAPDYHELLRSMSTGNETNGRAFAGQRESNSPAEDPGSKECQKIMQWLTSVHRGSGHSSEASMLNALKRKGVSPMVMRVAQDFHCEACEEANYHLPTHPPVSLEAMPPKWKQIQADQFEWEHPWTKLKAKFSLILDESCKVWVTKLLYQMVGQDRRRWLPYFGKPQRVKVGPEGSWMSKQAAQYFDSDSIGCEPIPGRAHWHISLAEEAIQATKGTMGELVTESPDMSTEGALARATAAGTFMRMCAAEQEYLRQVYLRRLSRAENAKNQSLKAVAPRMWVRYFREEKCEVKGRFKGLARVLAVETSRPVDGNLGANPTLHPRRAGPVVWLVRAGRIIKVDLCQIRAAPAREIASAELMAGKGAPWTVNACMDQAMRQECLDFSEQDEELASLEGVPEPAPPVKKTRREEPPNETGSERNQILVRRAIRKNAPPPGGVASIVKAAQAAQAEDIMMERAALMAKEVKKFSVAKATEVNKCVISSALESLPPGVTPPPGDVMRMRWILEWKVDETTRPSRHLVLQAMAWLGCKGYKADVTGAFAQNREIKHDLFVMPVRELAVALGMPEGVAMRLRKAVYGLVEAAIEWFMTVGEALEEFGWTQMKMDPCVWVLYGQSRGQGASFTKEALGQFTGSEVMGELIAAKGDLDIVAIAGSHVDDFLLGGKETDPRWVETRKKIEERFKLKAWETDEFMQTGVQIRQLPDMSFKTDQSEYVKTIEKAVLGPERKKNKDAQTTDKEKGQLRAILGAIGWRSEQSGPVHSADTSLLLSTMPSSTVQTLLDTSRLVDRVRAGADLPVVIHSHSSAQLRMYYNSGHRWKLVYDAKYQSAKKRKAAGILPFKSVPPGVLRQEDAGDGATCASAGTGTSPVGFPEYEVPGWDGYPKASRTYRRKALQYQECTKRQDRYLCGPRPEARLTGRAEVAVGRCKSGWLSRDDGVERLLAWLGRRCSRQAAPGVGQELDAFLIKTRRRKLKPMQQWRRCRMQRLRITLHGATGLQTLIDGLPDAYVLGEIPGKPWTRSRTRAARQELDPTWDEVLEMDDVGSEMLELKVVDERAAGVDEGLLGAVLLRAQDFGPRGLRGEWPLVLAGAEGLPPGARPPALQLSVAVEVGSCYTGGGGADGRPPGHAEEPLLERAWSEAVAAEQAVEHAFRGGAVAAERAAVGAIRAAEGAVSRAAAALGSVGHIGELFHLHGGGGAGAAERGAESASHSASPAAEGAASRAAAALGSLGHEMGELFHHAGGACAPPLDTLPPGAFDGDMLPPVGTLPHGAFQDLASTANSDGLSLGPPTGTMPPGAFEAALRAAAPPSSSSRPPSPPSAPPAPGGAGVHRLRVSVVSAKGLRNADWFGKSDPYCICEVPGSLQSRFTTDVVDDCLEPVWNKTVEFDWHRGAPLEFTVMDKDVWPKEDDLLGRATLPSERFFPFGFDGDLPLAMSGWASIA